jgi:hypothetical protein
VNFFAPDYSSVSNSGEIESIIDRAGCSNSSRDGRADATLRNIRTGGGVKSYSFGIEGLSERLRKAVNKPISDSDIVTVMRALQDGGVGIVRWYVILALPGETDSDCHKFIELLSAIREVYRGRLDVTTTHLHGLAHTPLQWIDGHFSEAAASRERAIVEWAKEKNIAGLAPGGLRGCEMYFGGMVGRKTHDADGYLYRAGREASAAIENANSVAARVKDGRWANGIDVESSLRAKSVDEPLPWDNVKTGVPKKSLALAWKTYQRRAECKS